MRRKIRVRGVKGRFITAGFCHRRLEIVGHRGMRSASAELETFYVSANPGPLVLTGRCVSEKITRRTPDRHKQLRRDQDSRSGFPDPEPFSEIHEKLFTAFVVLTHGIRKRLLVIMVELGELAVLVTVRMPLLVLFPKKRKRDVRPFHLLGQILKGNGRPRILFVLFPKEERLQSNIIHRFWKRPR